MNRQNLFADFPWDSEEHGAETGLRHRTFSRPSNARMGATLWELSPGAAGMRMHMHYGAEEMFFVLSGHPVWRNLEGEEELAPGDYVSCPEGRAGVHAFGNPHDEPARPSGQETKSPGVSSSSPSRFLQTGWPLRTKNISSAP